MKRREDTDIDHHFLPGLREAGIDPRNLRRNEATKLTSPLRGEFWISLLPHTHPEYESAIVALVECKDRKASLGDKDWQTACKDGQRKAKLQGLKSFFVTNTSTFTRCYSALDLSEISLDGVVINRIPSAVVLRAIQAQITSTRHNVFYRTFASRIPNANSFRSALWNIRQAFRSKGMSHGEEEKIIKCTLTFCILKIISERQKLYKILPSNILLWDDWRQSQANRDIINTINDIVKITKFKHLEGCLYIDPRLDAAASVAIMDQIGAFELFGSDFDFFGLVYETLASKHIKKDFGEFYTPRHIIRFMVRTLLRQEVEPRPLKICDPACGTGGFLVEAYLLLQNQYKDACLLDDAVLKDLRETTFSGFDNNDTYSIPYARTNMLMAGDGGAHIRWTSDSLIELAKDEYDYILANVPYGVYAGDADLTQFEFARLKRFEYLFLEKIIYALKPHGRAAVIVPDGLVENSSLKRYRLALLHAVNIEAVVSLPAFSFLPYTSEKTYIIYFNKKSEPEKGQIQKSSIWHAVIDNDGFQDGSKRYAINEDDLADVDGEEFMHKAEIDKFGHVSIDDHLANDFLALSSESYLRRHKPIEFGASEFNNILNQILASIQNVISDVGAT